MAFVVTVDGQRWRDHQDAVAAAVLRAANAPLVPVIKGNGYGLGQSLLTGEAVRLGADTVAVGTVFEVPDVAAQGNHDIVVLEPYDHRDSIASDAWWGVGQALHAGRVIRTVASTEALLSLAEGTGSVRVVLEAQTSLHRFGMDEAELLGVLADLRIREALERGRILIEGLTVHLPIAQPADEIEPAGANLGSAKVREVVRWAGLWQAETAVWSGHNSPECRVWISHLDDAELTAVAAAVPDVVLRLRSGSRLWHMKYRIDGREKRLSFGAYPAISLAQARKLRDEARARLAAGEDPGEVKKEDKRRKLLVQETTFAKLAGDMRGIW